MCSSEPDPQPVEGDGKGSAQAHIGWWCQTQHLDET